MTGALSAPAGDPWPRWLRKLTLASLALLLAACTFGAAEDPEAYDLRRATRLFAAGYQDISDVYIEDVDIPGLALAGIEGLRSLDPELRIEQEHQRLILVRDGGLAESLDLPEQESARDWGALTASVIETGRAVSPALAKANAEQLYEAVFDGMVGSLDAYSRYAGRDEAREIRASRDGFGGIGVVVRVVDEGILVVSVMEDTPAEEADLHAQDIITDIDGKSTVGLAQPEILRRLRGPIRTRVDLLVRRETEPEPLEKSVTRAVIVPQTVRYHAEDGIGVLRLSNFNQSTARNLRKMVKQARRDLDDDLIGFIIDLRGNRGGLLDKAVAVADLFVTDGEIVSTRGRHPDSHQYFNAESDDVAAGRPVVVLLNGGTASASEIVAAALQDSHRAVLVGTNTFGKGTVQYVARLPNEGELNLTWANFHAPSGYGLNGRGVLPDICTSGETGSLGEVLEKLRHGAFPLRHHLGTGLPDGNSRAQIAALRDSCPKRNGDPELDIEVARTLLLNPALYARALGKTPDSAHLDEGPEQASLE